MPDDEVFKLGPEYTSYKYKIIEQEKYIDSTFSANSLGDW